MTILENTNIMSQGNIFSSNILFFCMFSGLRDGSLITCTSILGKSLILWCRVVWLIVIRISEENTVSVFTVKVSYALKRQGIKDRCWKIGNEGLEAERVGGWEGGLGLTYGNPYPLKWATTAGGEVWNCKYERTFGLHAPLPHITCHFQNFASLYLEDGVRL